MRSSQNAQPLGEGARQRRRIECPAGAPFYVAVSVFLKINSHSPFPALQNSASSRQSIPCPSGTPFSKGGRVLRLFQYFAALLIFMRRTTISHFSFLISHSNEAFKPNQGTARPTG